jgi:hypothetical protein
VYAREAAHVRVAATSADGEWGLRGDGPSHYVGPGPSDDVVEIVLWPLESLGAMRVRVACRDGVATPFALQVIDLESNHVLARVMSEELPPDGLLTGLPLGELKVALDERYREPAELYDPGAPGTATTVELDLDETPEVTFSVSCGGRVALLVEGSPSERVVEARLSRIGSGIDDADEDIPKLPLLVLHPDGTWSDRFSLAFGQRAIARDPLEPGRYRLRVTTSTGDEFLREVEVERGKVTECVFSTRAR